MEHDGFGWLFLSAVDNLREVVLYLQVSTSATGQYQMLDGRPSSGHVTPAAYHELGVAH